MSANLVPGVRNCQRRIVSDLGSKSDRIGAATCNHQHLVAIRSLLPVAGWSGTVVGGLLSDHC